MFFFQYAFDYIIWHMRSTNQSKYTFILQKNKLKQLLAEPRFLSSVFSIRDQLIYFKIRFSKFGTRTFKARSNYVSKWCHFSNVSIKCHIKRLSVNAKDLIIEHLLCSRIDKIPIVRLLLWIPLWICFKCLFCMEA